MTSNRKLDRGQLWRPLKYRIFKMHPIRTHYWTKWVVKPKLDFKRQLLQTHPFQPNVDDFRSRSIMKQLNMTAVQTG